MITAGVLIDAVREAISCAESDIPKHRAEMLSVIPGMSSRKGRLFLNQLCHLLKNINYLEIGSWMGSMLCSALYLNTEIKAYAIDNFSGFVQSEKQPYNVREMLHRHLIQYSNGNHSFFDADCWKFDKALLPKIDVYFFDGDHDYESQYKAFIEYDSVLSDKFIAIVDDWEFPPCINDVQQGTLDAFKKLDYEIVAQRVLPKAEHWHEGMFVAVIQKRS
jgi:predicted O-methyltransferase YrrM